MIKIRKEKCIDVSDFSEEVKAIYRDFVSTCGLSNGERWPYCIGESGDDNTLESWIGEEKRKLIDAEIINNSDLKQGDEILLVFEW